MIRRLLTVCLVLLAGTVCSAATDQVVRSAPITIGISHAIDSTTLGDRRTINVVLPASYGAEPYQRYPVLYLIDGGVTQDLLHISGVVHLGALWGRSAEAIVVGIETKDRRRELTGPTSDPELLKRYPTAGSSARFREFVRADVKPLVERLYRTNGRDVVLGESLAGLFVAETYLAEPSLFDAYGAVDPSLWWDKEALSLGAGNRLNRSKMATPLFLALAREQSEEPAAAKRLVSALRAKALPICVMARPDLTHGTIYQQVTPQALQYLLPPQTPISDAFGFKVDCSDPF